MVILEHEQEDKEISPLKHLHNTQVSLEKFRIQLSNRTSAIARGVDGAKQPVPDIYSRLTVMAEEMEAEIDQAISKELKRWPVWEYWLKHVKGIGPSLGGQMLALLLPPTPQKGPSSWYKAAGLTVQEIDGVSHLPRDRADNPATHHRWLRRCLHNVGTSFVRNGGYYRRVYEEAKARFQAQHTGDDKWPVWRIDSVARWKMVKIFLSDLWEMWCEAESIHNRGPYGLTTLADGTQVVRIVQPDGSYQDHALKRAPRWVGEGKI